MKRFAGSKWLNEASYITEEGRAEALKLVAEASAAGCERVGVQRPQQGLRPCFKDRACGMTAFLAFVLELVQAYGRIDKEGV